MIIPGTGAMPQMARTPYVPGSSATVWQSATITQSIPNGYASYSLRQRLNPLTGGGRQFRFTFLGARAVAKIGFQVAGFDHNALYQPVAIGGLVGNVAYPGTVLSNWIELPQAVDASQALIVIFDLAAGAGGDFRYGNAEIGSTMWYQGGVFTSDIATPPGLWSVHPTYVGLVTQVEAR